MKQPPSSESLKQARDERAERLAKLAETMRRHAAEGLQHATALPIPEALNVLMEQLGQPWNQQPWVQQPWMPQVDGQPVWSAHGWMPNIGVSIPTAASERTQPRPPQAETPAGARFLSGSFANAAGHRPYKLFVPSGYHGQAVPLVVMLHGCSQSPDDFATGTRMNRFAEEQTFLVVYPGQTVADHPGKCWKWFNAADQQRDRGEPSIIAGITRQVMEDYAVDPGRVFMVGFSAGGATAATMSALYPDLYAAAGVHSGLACGAAGDISAALVAMRQGGAGRRPGDRVLPTIVFHGDADTTVHPRNGDAVAAQALPGGTLTIETQQGRVPGGHSYTRTIHANATKTVLEQWTVHGSNHGWCGGDTAGSFTDPKGPDATREILRFLMAHARR